MKKKRIGVITGGFQSQHTVNVNHARDIAEALSTKYEAVFFDLSVPKEFDQFIKDYREGKIDIVFNNAAGKRGGDGTIEGFLEVLGIPFVGSDTLATAVAFDKKTTKTVVAAAGVPIVRGLSVTETDLLERQDEVIATIEKKIGYPLVVKASQGSDSIGISLVKKPEDLMPAILLALREDEVIIIEDFIKRSAEVTCMVIGNGNDLRALEPVERVYDTEMLYSQDISERSYRTPDCSDEIKEKIKEYSIMAHKALGCSDYSRSDFLISVRNKIFFLELNGHAGLGRGGPTEFAANTTEGWDYPTLIHCILDIAIARHKAPHLA